MNLLEAFGLLANSVLEETVPDKGKAAAVKWAMKAYPQTVTTGVLYRATYMSKEKFDGYLLKGKTTLNKFPVYNFTKKADIAERFLHSSRDETNAGRVVFTVEKKIDGLDVYAALRLMERDIAAWAMEKYGFDRTWEKEFREAKGGGKMATSAEAAKVAAYELLASKNAYISQNWGSVYNWEKFSREQEINVLGPIKVDMSEVINVWFGQTDRTLPLSLSPVEDKGIKEKAWTKLLSVFGDSKLKTLLAYKPPKHPKDKEWIRFVQKPVNTKWTPVYLRVIEKKEPDSKPVAEAMMVRTEGITGKKGFPRKEFVTLVELWLNGKCKVKVSRG